MAHSKNVGPPGATKESPWFVSSDQPDVSDPLSELSLSHRPPSAHASTASRSSPLRPDRPRSASQPSPLAKASNPSSSPPNAPLAVSDYVAGVGDHLRSGETAIERLKRKYPGISEELDEIEGAFRGIGNLHKRLAMTDELNRPTPELPRDERKDSDELEDDDEPWMPSSIPSTLNSSELDIVDTEPYVYEMVFGAIQKIHARDPTHPMFGPMTKDRIRCPIGPILPKVANEVSWHRKIKDLARQIAKNSGSKMLRQSCWMIQGGYQIIFQTKETRYASVTPVRFLCFVGNPSREYWHILTDQKHQVAGGFTGVDRPFCHLCHNGIGSKEDKRKSKCCVNGIQHGFFGTPAENNTMKPCSTAAGRWICPGHGVDGRYRCKFVDKNTGALLPCRNGHGVLYELDCQHLPNCFQGS